MNVQENHVCARWCCDRKKKYFCTMWAFLFALCMLVVYSQTSFYFFSSTKNYIYMLQNTSVILWNNKGPPHSHLIRTHTHNVKSARDNMVSLLVHEEEGMLKTCARITTSLHYTTEQVAARLPWVRDSVCRNNITVNIQHFISCVCVSSYCACFSRIVSSFSSLLFLFLLSFLMY